jgi:hypothetical protein
LGEEKRYDKGGEKKRENVHEKEDKGNTNGKLYLKGWNMGKKKI